MNLNLIASLLWIGGTIIVVLSWRDTISREIGWIGFGVAIVGVVLSLIPQFRGRRNLPSEDNR